MRTCWMMFIACLVWTSAVSANNRLPCPAEFFEVNGRRAFVMKPEKPTDGSPWVWYAPTLKNYPHGSQRFYFEQLLQHGIAVAGYDLGGVRSAARSSTKRTAFYEAMVANGYSSKPVLLGQSRGGLMLLGRAFRNPEKVKAFAGIYPICNLTSWPLQNSHKTVLPDYGLLEKEIVEQLARFNP